MKFTKKAKPFLLIFIGILLLPILYGVIGGAFIIIGIMILIERKWPEKLESENNNHS